MHSLNRYCSNHSNSIKYHMKRRKNFSCHQATPVRWWLIFIAGKNFDLLWHELPNYRLLQSPISRCPFLCLWHEFSRIMGPWQAKIMQNNNPTQTNPCTPHPNQPSPSPSPTAHISQAHLSMHYFLFFLWCKPHLVSLYSNKLGEPTCHPLQQRYKSAFKCPEQLFLTWSRGIISWNAHQRPRSW